MKIRKQWSQKIIKSFENAAEVYNENASLQQKIAWELASKCSYQNIAKGVWVDLGTGTGFLANALEELNPYQKVLRIDGSKKMLELHHKNSRSQLWDLDLGLPKWDSSPQLLASSFALHWLTNPIKTAKEWFESLDDGGWLALALPIETSFPEWKLAAKSACVTYSGLTLPSPSSLIKVFPQQSIQYQAIECITQRDNEVLSLLKPMRRIGAHVSEKKSLNLGALRRLKKSWPQSKDSKIAELTWHIQILLIQR